jgi:outer membrane lipase/esterase
MSGATQAGVAYKKSQHDSGEYDSKDKGKCAPGCDCGPKQPDQPPPQQTPPPVQQTPPPPSGGSTVNLPPASPPSVPLTFGTPADVAQISELGFASTLFGRLDLFRQAYGIVPPVDMPVKARPYGKALPLSAISPWSIYLQANGGVSDRQATAVSDGFHLDSVGGTVGAEYRLSPNAIVGAAFDYSNPEAHLNNNAGTTEANSYQFGLYGGWTDRNFFVQGLATAGFQDYRNTRPGLGGGAITSSPDGSTFVVGGKTGYLFDIGPTQLGPIGGLTYAYAHVNGFTEQGDPAQTFAVRAQTEEALIGSVGMQLRAPFMVHGTVISPYVNLTAEDDFIGNGRLIQFNASSTPLIVSNLNVPNGASKEVYGRVTAGVVAPVWRNVSFSANVSRTFARDTGDDFYGSGGLKISF